MRRRFAVTSIVVVALAWAATAALGGSTGHVSIAVRPAVYARTPLMVYGSVAGQELVTVQFEQCGLYPVRFRDFVEVRPETNGAWTTQLGIPANGTLRAVAGGHASNEVKVLARPDVRIEPTRSGKYQVHVVSHLSFWRKRVQLQRLVRGRGWVAMRTLRLEDSGAAPGSAFVWSSSDPFPVRLPKGTTLRAVLPAAQARPCYLAGYSKLIRT